MPEARCPHGWKASVEAVNNRNDGFIWGKNVCPTTCKIGGWESSARRMSVAEAFVRV